MVGDDEATFEALEREMAPAGAERRRGQADVKVGAVREADVVLQRLSWEPPASSSPFNATTLAATGAGKLRR